MTGGVPHAFRLAVLIDAENAPAAAWPAVAATVQRLGVAALVRAYSCRAVPGWSSFSAIEWIDGRPADGANAADFLLAMDAAVLAAERRVDGFVLVTGDDGFSAVALDLKRRGATVFALIPLNGAGSPVPRRLAAAAYLAVLVPCSGEPAAFADPKPAPAGRLGRAGDGWGGAVMAALSDCASGQDGWTELSVLGQALKPYGLKRPRKTLYDSLGEVRGVELRGKRSSASVRRLPDLEVEASSADLALAGMPAQAIGEPPF